MSEIPDCLDDAAFMTQRSDIIHDVELHLSDMKNECPSLIETNGKPLTEQIKGAFEKIQDKHGVRVSFALPTDISKEDMAAYQETILGMAKNLGSALKKLSKKERAVLSPLLLQTLPFRANWPFDKNGSTVLQEGMNGRSITAQLNDALMVYNSVGKVQYQDELAKFLSNPNITYANLPYQEYSFIDTQTEHLILLQSKQAQINEISRRVEKIKMESGYPNISIKVEMENLNGFPNEKDLEQLQRVLAETETLHLFYNQSAPLIITNYDEQPRYRDPNLYLNITNGTEKEQAERLKEQTIELVDSTLFYLRERVEKTHGVKTKPYTTQSGATMLRKIEVLEAADAYLKTVTPAAKKELQKHDFYLFGKGNDDWDVSEGIVFTNAYFEKQVVVNAENRIQEQLEERAYQKMIKEMKEREALTEKYGTDFQYMSRRIPREKWNDEILMTFLATIQKDHSIDPTIAILDEKSYTLSDLNDPAIRDGILYFLNQIKSFKNLHYPFSKIGPEHVKNKDYIDSFVSHVQVGASLDEAIRMANEAFVDIDMMLNEFPLQDFFNDEMKSIEKQIVKKHKEDYLYGMVRTLRASNYAEKMAGLTPNHLFSICVTLDFIDASAFQEIMNPINTPNLALFETDIDLFWDNIGANQIDKFRFSQLYFANQKPLFAILKNNERLRQEWFKVLGATPGDDITYQARSMFGKLQINERKQFEEEIKEQKEILEENGNTAGAQSLDRFLETWSFDRTLKKKYGVHPKPYDAFVDGTSTDADPSERQERITYEKTLRQHLSNAINFVNEMIQADPNLQHLGVTITETEVVTNFLCEGAILGVKQSQKSFSAYGGLGLDAFMEKFRQSNSLHRKFIPDRMHASFDGKETKNLKNEGGMNSLEFHATLEEALFASAAEFATRKISFAKDVKNLNGIDISTMTKEAAFFWTTIYFNAGEGAGRSILQSKGLNWYKKPWIKDDSHRMYSNSAKYNATWRTCAYEKMKHTLEKEAL